MTTTKPTSHTEFRIRPIGGLNTRGMLLSYQPLSEWDKQRAKDLRIETVVGTDILRLRERLIAWMSPKG